MPFCGLPHTTKRYQCLVYRTDQTRIVTHHNLPERSSSKYIQNLVLLLLREARGLREESVGKICDPRHG